MKVSVVCPSIRPSSVAFHYFQTTSPLKPRSRFFSYFTYSIYRSGERIIVFCSVRIRTLVAIATYSSQRLIMGKEEIDNFFCLIGDNWIKVQKCLLRSPLHFIIVLSKSANLIGCRAAKRVNFRKNVSKSSFQKP